MSQDSAKRAETLKSTLRKYRKTGPIQTSLGTWEQGLTLPFTEIAGLVDDAEAVAMADRVSKVAWQVLLAKSDPEVLAGRLQALEEVLNAYTPLREGGRTLAGMVGEKREALAEDVHDLLKAMNSSGASAQWGVKNGRALVEDDLIALRNLIVVQREQAGTTQVKTREAFMEEAQQLVSALADGQGERAKYHADNLWNALHDVVIGAASTLEVL